MGRVIYISSKFSNRRRILHYVQILEDVGFVVRAKWLTEDEALADLTDSLAPSLEINHYMAARDMEQVAACDIFIIDTTEGLAHNGGGGREVELGMAIILDKDCYRVGTSWNIFHTVIPHHNSWQSLIEYLKENYRNA